MQKKVSGIGLPPKAKIPTPVGTLALSALQVGDKIFGRDGQPTTIVEYETQGQNVCFSVELHDGRTFYAGEREKLVIKNAMGGFDAHTVQKVIRDCNIVEGIKSTASQRRYRIPLCKPVEYKSELELPTEEEVRSREINIFEKYAHASVQDKFNLLHMYFKDEINLSTIKRGLAWASRRYADFENISEFFWSLGCQVSRQTTDTTNKVAYIVVSGFEPVLYAMKEAKNLTEPYEYCADCMCEEEGGKDNCADCTGCSTSKSSLVIKDIGRRELMTTIAIKVDNDDNLFLGENYVVCRGLDA